MSEELTSKFYKTCEELLGETTNLVECSRNNLEPFVRVLQGVCRRGFYKLHSIMVLCSDDFTGDAVLDLSRSLLEDMIAVEFMKLKGAPAMAKKFLDYSFVEQKLDMDFLIKNEGNVDNTQVLETNKDFEKVKESFMRKKGEVSRSWASCDLEHMIKELTKSNILQEFEKEMILQAYIMGNRKNHLSPIDVLSFISPEFRVVAKNSSKETGLLFSLVSYIKIADEFALQVHANEVDEKLKGILKRLNNEGFQS